MKGVQIIRDLSELISKEKRQNDPSQLIGRLDNYPDILSAYQCMEILNLGKNSVYKLIKNNIIPSFRMAGGRKYLIPKKGLADFIESMCYNDQSVSGSFSLCVQ